nr:helix-turn-helix transcriptional regulator [Amycolatopsis suaedae]
MHARYFEPLTLTELAAEVYVSPFHFSRIFARAVGVTPGRYLTAVRLFEAKRLLLTTSLTVSDIVCGVGYSSVGTFTSRFTRAVGMTPTQFRDPEVGELLIALSPRLRRVPSVHQLRESNVGCVPAPSGGGVVTGHVDVAGTAANLVIGVFPDAVPQRGPVAFTGRSDAGSTDFVIEGVPDGEWVVMAVAEHPGPAVTPFTVGSARCVVRRGSGTVTRLSLRAPRPTDPPIAITLAGRQYPTANHMHAGRPRLRAVAAPGGIREVHDVRPAA